MSKNKLSQSREEDNRPTPEAMLDEANLDSGERTDSRGRLRIFMGAAPGVGKTFAMLEAAQRLREEKLDIVIGVVETHGRTETKALVDGLEMVPMRQLTYRGLSFQEMDLDAILARKPALVLVDELAHTNIPGSRHPKRYQDVEELLKAGIDVYSTLNIQHLESLNDVVSRVSRVQVRETIPDRILDIADDIELIDLPTKELQKRLKEGKVYLPEQAKRAAKHFFSHGNLTALRELALRYAAERVDSQMLNFTRTHGIQGPWPTRDRMMVCIGDKAGLMQLVRACSRIAERRHASWIAVHVETPWRGRKAQASQELVSQAMQLATEMGGEAVTLIGMSTIEELIRFARERNITRIIVGKSKRPLWQRRFLGPSIASGLLNQGDAYEVLVVPTGQEAQNAAPPQDTPIAPRKNVPFRLRDYIKATLAVALTTLIAFGLDSIIKIPNLSLIFLAATLYVALRVGLWPAFYSIFLSFLTYSFFFREPRFALTTLHPEHVVSILFFILVAGITSHLANLIRSQMELVRKHARRTENLYEFGKKVSAAQDLQSVVLAVVHHLAVTLNCKAIMLMPEKEGEPLVITASHPRVEELDDVSRGAVEWVWKSGEPAGRSSNTLPASPWFFMPVRTGSEANESIRSLGVLGIYFEEKDDSQILLPEQRQLIDSVCHQAAISMERTMLVRGVEEAKLTAETERLRSSLLSSISHDFRTPLASIIECVVELQEKEKTLNEAARQELLETIHDEADRLNRFVQTLLDMTRYGTGSLELKRKIVSVRDIVTSALARLKKTLSTRNIELQIAEDVPFLYADYVLLEQVIVNLLDNACKYGEAGSTIKLTIRREAEMVVIECVDQGRGIPTQEREHVFEMFYRIDPAEEGQSAGIGLGLAICRGIIEAHGGTIVASEAAEGGTRMIIRLPISGAAEA